MIRYCVPCLVLVALGIVAGCGGDGLTRVPIEGVLTAGGDPIEGATVQLIPAGSTPGEGGLGKTDAEGKFTVISSRESDAGIPPGDYTVRVRRLMDGDKILPPDTPEADYPNSRESIPMPYSGGASPLKVTISEAGGKVEVKIPNKLKKG